MKRRKDVYDPPEGAWCCLDGDYSCEGARVRYADGGRVLKISFRQTEAAAWNRELFGPREGKKRRCCRGFSWASRRRMLERVNEVSCGASLPDFVTMTFPDDCFDDRVDVFAKEAKAKLDVWLKRLARVCPEAAGFWRIEWKARLSGLYVGKLFPHFHLLVWGLPQRLIGRVSNEGKRLDESFVRVVNKQAEFANLMAASVGIRRASSSDEARDLLSEVEGEKAGEYRFYDSDGFYGVVKRSSLKRWDRAVQRVEIARRGGESSYMSFRDWCALSWYHVVASGNPAHFAAGVRVERLRSWGGVSYCAKSYLTKTDADSFLVNVAFGRSWGIFNRAGVPWARIVELDLEDDVGVRLRRIARRYLEHRLGRRVRRSYGLTLYCDAHQWARLFARPPDCPF